MCCHGKGPTTHSRHEIGMISVFHKLKAQITCCIFSWGQRDQYWSKAYTQSISLDPLHWSLNDLHVWGLHWTGKETIRCQFRTIAKLLGSKLLARLLSYTRWFFCRDVYFLAQHEFIKKYFCIYYVCLFRFSHFKIIVFFVHSISWCSFILYLHCSLF